MLTPDLEKTRHLKMKEMAMTSWTLDLPQRVVVTGTASGLGQECAKSLLRAGVQVLEPDTAAGYLLDGFPRTIEQAQWLDSTLAGQDRSLDVVLLLTADDEVLIERLTTRGRSDDTPDVIERRLAIYHQETAPLLAHYRRLVIEIDGAGPVDEVHHRVRTALAGLEVGTSTT